MAAVAIYPGTFDPLTNGHVDIVERGLAIFDRVIVAVAPSSRKQVAFSWEKRVEMAKAVFKLQASVLVLALEGLLVDFAQRHDAKIILRGVRAVSDFDYEFQMANANRYLCNDLETLLLPAKEGYSYLSGTLIREIVTLGGDVTSLVPEPVAQVLKYPIN